MKDLEIYYTTFDEDDDLSLEEQEQLKYDETYEKTQQLLEQIKEGIVRF